MYLVDTNVWLERLLGQERSEEVGQFLDKILSRHLWLTDFAFHSIALSLSRHKRIEVFERFINDVFVEGAIVLISLRPEDLLTVIQVMGQFTLDFDDAYQYVAAEKHGLTIVSFDAHFDRTERGRKTPGQALEVYVQKEEDE